MLSRKPQLHVYGEYMKSIHTSLGVWDGLSVRNQVFYQTNQRDDIYQYIAKEDYSIVSSFENLRVQCQHSKF